MTWRTLPRWAFIKTAFALGCAVVTWAAGAGPLQAQDNSPAFQQAMAKAVRQAANEVLDAVVSIEVIGVAETASRQDQQSEVASDAPTCGVVVDPEGWIVASEIVVRRPAASILVVLPDRTRLAAEVVARDHHRGLVLLRVEPKSPLPAVQLPDEVDLPIGSTVVAVGRYGGDVAAMVSSGILSATGRLEGTMLQTDARVSPTFYGGALVDLRGRPIGILVPAVAEGGAADETSWYDSGIAFAVPTPVLKNKLARLRDGDDIRKGLIGIVPATKDPYSEGTRLAAVRNRSPAQKAGIQPGDSVKSVAGRPVRMFQQIKQALGPFDAGEEVELEVQRDGETLSFSITLAESIPPLQPQRLGVWAEAVAGESGDAAPPADADEDLANAVVVRGTVPGLPADGKLQSGDEIESIDGTEIRSVSAAKRLMTAATPETEVTVSVRREEEVIDVKITPEPVAGPILTETLASWRREQVDQSWDVKPLRLPDVSNPAAYVAPEVDDTDPPAGLGLVMLLLSPDKRDPAEELQSWREVATRYGVVVCAVCSDDEKRWQQDEVDVVSRMATLLAQRVPVATMAVAAPGVVEGVGASAADSMVIAIALSDRKNFAGAAVSEDAKPPAVRLRENEPDNPLEILMPIDALENGPTWLAPLSKAGYPVTLGGEVQLGDLLRWVRLLQTI